MNCGIESNSCWKYYCSSGRRENGVGGKGLFKEIMTPNFLKLEKTIHLQIQESQQNHVG